MRRGLPACPADARSRPECRPMGADAPPALLPVTEGEVAARVAEWRPRRRRRRSAPSTASAPRRCFDVVVDRASGGGARAARRRSSSSTGRREREPDWYQRPGRVGYIAYADRFGGDLAGVAAADPLPRASSVSTCST